MRAPQAIRTVARADSAGIFEPDGSPGLNSTRPIRSKACCAPLTMKIWSASQATPRLERKCPAIAARSARMPVRVGIAHDAVARLAPMLGGQPRPDRQRKRIVVRQAGDEGARFLRMGQPLEKARRRVRDEIGELCRPCQQHVSTDSLPWLRGRRLLRNKRAGSGARDDQSFRRQTLEDSEHRRAGNVQLPGQGAAGRQPLAGRQVARHDQLPNGVVHLRGDGLAERTVDRNGEQEFARRSFHHGRRPGTHLSIYAGIAGFRPFRKWTRLRRSILASPAAGRALSAAPQRPDFRTYGRPASAARRAVRCARCIA